MVATILVYKLAADRFGDEGFDLYAIARRTNSFLLPLAMAGLSVAVVRSVAMAGNKDERTDLLRSAFKVLVSICLLLAIIFFLFPAELAFLIFGDRSLAGLVLPLAGLVIGQVLHALLYAFWRGSGRMAFSNMLQIVDLALVPIVAFLVPGPLRMVLMTTAAAWVVIPLCPLLAIVLRQMERPRADRSRSLLKFGLPRVPGDLALAALLTLPVYVINHTHGFDVGGQVAFGSTLLNLTGALFAPISLLMLPSIASALARKDHAAVTREVERTRKGTILIAAAIVAIFLIFARPLLDIYLDGAPAGLVEVTRIIFPAAIFYALFISLRSVLDAYFESARNSRNILIALVCFVAGAAIHIWVWPEGLSILWMIPVSMFILAALTWRDVQRVLGELRRSEGT